jgi:hypothetical protein
MPAVLPPAVVVDPLPEPADADPPADPVGKDDVGTLSGSDSTLPPLAPPPPPAVLPLAVAAPSAPVWSLCWSIVVWAWAAAVMPTNVIAIRRIFRIAFSGLKVIPNAGWYPTEDNTQDNAQVRKNKNEI